MQWAQLQTSKPSFRLSIQSPDSKADSRALGPDLDLHGQPSSSLTITSTGSLDDMPALPMDRTLSVQIPVLLSCGDEGVRPDSGQDTHSFLSLPYPQLPWQVPGKSNFSCSLSFIS